MTAAVVLEGRVIGGYDVMRVPDFFQVYFYIRNFEHEFDVLVRVSDSVEESLNGPGNNTLADFAVNITLHSVGLINYTGSL